MRTEQVNHNNSQELFLQIPVTARTFSNFTMVRDWLGVPCPNRAWTLGVSAESQQVTLTWIPLLSGLI